MSIESFLPKEPNALPDISIAIGWDDSITVKISFPPKEANRSPSVASLQVPDLGEAGLVVDFAKNIIHAAGGGEIQEIPVNSDFNEAQIQQDDMNYFNLQRSFELSLRQNTEKFLTFLADRTEMNAVTFINGLGNTHRNVLIKTLKEFPSEQTKNVMHLLNANVGMANFAHAMTVEENEAVMMLKRLYFDKAT